MSTDELKILFDLLSDFIWDLDGEELKTIIKAMDIVEARMNK